jgi:hypothetical protein
MKTFDADTVMVLAGVVLSIIAAQELYVTWKRTQQHERTTSGTHD